MKWILELVLTAIILFFVWNILKRLFFKTFYSYRFKDSHNNKQQDIQNSNKNANQKINWDAETVDYEEIKETKDKK